MKGSRTLLVVAVSLLPLLGASAAPPVKSPGGAASKEQSPVKVTGPPASSAKSAKNADSCPRSSPLERSTTKDWIKFDAHAPFFIKRSDDNYHEDKIPPRKKTVTRSKRTSEVPFNNSNKEAFLQKRNDKVPPPEIVVANTGKLKMIYVAPGETKYTFGDELLWTDNCTFGICVAIGGFAMDNNPPASKKYGSILHHHARLNPEIDARVEGKAQQESLLQALRAVSKRSKENHTKTMDEAGYTFDVRVAVFSSSPRARDLPNLDEINKNYNSMWEKVFGIIIQEVPEIATTSVGTYRNCNLPNFNSKCSTGMLAITPAPAVESVSVWKTDKV